MKLGVPGEHLNKVTYGLMDAQSYQGRRVLVVGGGDSAVEAAMALAKQQNEVTLSYRKSSFFRVRTRNMERLEACVERGDLRVLYQSNVVAIEPESVRLAVRGAAGDQEVELPNDDMFILAGGSAPFEMLEGAGVSFDQSQREAPAVIEQQGGGVLRALQIGLALSTIALVWALLNADYYLLPPAERAVHAKHLFLRSGRGLGLAFGIGSTLLIVVNLLYLVRRSPKFKLQWGSLSGWMTSHVATGILTVLFALMHGVMNPENSAGGHAFWGLVFLLVTGAIGRYFYAWVPRATNGRELDLAEVKAKLAGPLSISKEDSEEVREFQKEAGQEVIELIENRQWRGSLLGRIAALVGMQGDLRKTTTGIAERGNERGVSEEQINATISLARGAFRRALMLAHFEDLRGILSTWRYFHRWMAVLMVALVVVHIVYALTYGELFDAVGAR